MSGHDDSEREEIRTWQKRLAAEQLDAAPRRDEDEQREREYLRLVAEHGSWQEAAWANPDRREEILDAACTDENESRAAMAPVLNLAQLTRESFDVKFDRFVQERRKAEARARREAEEDELRRLRLEEARADAKRRGSDSAGDRMGRPPGELSIASVERAEARLLERREVTSVGGRGKGKHSYEAIATYAGLTRDRVVEIEQLMVVGWPLRESHPDFPAKPGFVRLPSPRKAAQLLRSR